MMAYEREREIPNQKLRYVTSPMSRIFSPENNWPAEARRAYSRNYSPKSMEKTDNKSDNGKLSDCYPFFRYEFRYAWLLLSRGTHYGIDHTIISFFIIVIQILSFKEILAVRYKGVCTWCALYNMS